MITAPPGLTDLEIAPVEGALGVDDHETQPPAVDVVVNQLRSVSKPTGVSLRSVLGLPCLSVATLRARVVAAQGGAMALTSMLTHFSLPSSASSDMRRCLAPAVAEVPLEDAMVV